jgi:hypothetical protein
MFSLLGCDRLLGQHLSWARDHIIHTPSPPPPALHGGRGILHLFVIDSVVSAASAASRARDMPQGTRAVFLWVGSLKGLKDLCARPAPQALVAVLISVHDGDHVDDYSETKKQHINNRGSGSLRYFAAVCPGSNSPTENPPHHLPPTFVSFLISPSFQNGHVICLCS